MGHEARSLRGQPVVQDVKERYSTFYIAGRLYGIDVTKVQEVVKPMVMTRIPLSGAFVRGLINLRGQVATAIGLRELFGLEGEAAAPAMNVVCRCEGNLVSLLVDEIGDVIEVSRTDFESTPRTIPAAVRKHMSGVFKLSGALLSVIDVDRLCKYLND